MADREEVCKIHKVKYIYTCPKCEEDMSDAFGVNKVTETIHNVRKK